VLLLLKDQQMDIKIISEKLLLKDRKDVLRLHLYALLLNKGITPYEKDLDILVTLYEYGGYKNSKEQHAFFTLCLDKSLKKSIQSIRNTLAVYTDLGVLDKPKNTIRHLNKEWLPRMDGNQIVLDYKISHK
jgi:hypothetical protein